MPINDNTSNVMMSIISASTNRNENNKDEIETVAVSAAPNVESPTNDTTVKVALRMQNSSGPRLDNKGKRSV